MKTLEELLKTPRMFYAPLIENNSVAGLLDLIFENVRPDFSIIEIGSFSGVSSDLFARYCEKLKCVDVWEMGSKGLKIYQLKRARIEFDEMLKGHKNISKINDTSLNASRLFTSAEFDMVYIDAVHDYEDVKEDIKAWWPKIRRGGFISGHDIQMEGVRMAVEEIIGTNYKIYKDESWIYQIK